ncbi:MAG: hypothetical protein ABIJ56_08005 [Pseudomonadota bacterium]
MTKQKTEAGLRGLLWAVAILPLAGLAFGAILLLFNCSQTPGVPMPPPNRESFTIMEPKLRCDDVSVVEVIATAGEFEVGELILITNQITYFGIVAPVETDGSVSVEVPAANAEAISIARRSIDGDESLPIDCAIPAPFDNKCVSPN